MSFAALAWLVVGINFIMAALVLLRPWRRSPDSAAPLPITLVQAMLAATAAAGLLVFECLAGLGRNPFGLIRLVYMHLVVLAPAMGLLVLALPLLRRHGRRPYTTSLATRLLAMLTLLAIPVGIYATFIEPFRLRLETTQVPLRTGRDAGEEIRIAILADIQTDHIGEHERLAIDLTMAQHPDIILLPGDLWQSEAPLCPEDAAALRELLCKLSAPGGVWFAPGNLDWPAQIDSLLAGTPVVSLNNAIAQTKVKGRQVTIGGVELYHTPRAAAIIQELESPKSARDIRILLGHLPDNVLYLQPESRIDLVVAGHTHGGQIVIPGLGPLITFSGVPRSAAAGGLHRVNDNNLYVSRGIGCERGEAPRVRFFCPPEVSLLTVGAVP